MALPFGKQPVIECYGEPPTPPAGFPEWQSDFIVLQQATRFLSRRQFQGVNR